MYWQAAKAWSWTQTSGAWRPHRPSALQQMTYATAPPGQTNSGGHAEEQHYSASAALCDCALCKSTIGVDWNSQSTQQWLTLIQKRELSVVASQERNPLTQVVQKGTRWLFSGTESFQPQLTDSCTALSCLRDAANSATEPGPSAAKSI